MAKKSLPFLSFLSGALALDKAPALFDDFSEKWTTYGQVRSLISEMLPLWQRTPRSFVLCACDRTSEGMIATLSAAAAGHALLMADPGMTRLRPYIKAYAPTWIITSGNVRPEGGYSNVDCPFEHLGLWRKADETPQEIHPDLFLMFPKPAFEGDVRTVRLSYENIASNITASIEATGFDNTQRPVCPMPLSYSFGLATLFQTFCVGGSALLTEQDIKNRAFWEKVRDQQVTLFPGIPFHFHYMARAGLDYLHVPRLKTFWQAGGRMPNEQLQELLKQMQAREAKFFVMYGLTEASPRISLYPLHEKPEKLGSLGKPIPGGRFEIEEDELIYYGPGVMMGYAHDAQDLHKGDELQGRLPTGEHVYCDEDGFPFPFAR